MDKAEQKVSWNSRTICHTLRQSNNGEIQQQQIHRFHKYTSKQHTKDKLHHVALQKKNESELVGEVQLGQALKTGEHLIGSAVSAIV